MAIKSAIKYKLRRAFPFESWHTDFRHSIASEGTCHPQVRWLSHHMPKTAGRSLEGAYHVGFGKKRVLSAYSDTSTAQRLNCGKVVWTPRDAIVIHGHFKPHLAQSVQFPNAQRLIWLRDPLKRAISLLHFIELHRMRKGSFEAFKLKFPSAKFSLEERLFNFLADPTISGQTSSYITWLEGFNPADFAFIGQVETYAKDLVRLSTQMEVHLPQLCRNQATPQRVAMDEDRLKELLKDEYDIYNIWAAASLSQS